MNENSENIRNYGDLFQQKSKYTRENLPKHYLDWLNKPDAYKKYEKPISRIELPKPEFKKGIDFWKVILNRKSIRKYGDDPISKQDLSLLLFGMSGLTRIYPQFAYRTTPSAGGLYPIEIYPAINNVEGLKQGIYHYNILEHSLECLKEGDFRKDISEGCLGQRIAYNSAVNFIWTAIIERSQWKYVQRCYRYIYLDSGHIGQNFYLIAEALGLGACTIGAIFDDELNNLLDIDGKNETTIYVGVVGKKYKKT
jgi:SagB-type dehydrogenase family enzyme